MGYTCASQLRADFVVLGFKDPLCGFEGMKRGRRGEERTAQPRQVFSVTQIQYLRQGEYVKTRKPHAYNKESHPIRCNTKTRDLVYMRPGRLFQRLYNWAIGVAVLDENSQRCRFGPPQGQQHWCAVLQSTKSVRLRANNI